MKIKSIDAFEILDSRGNPTVRVRLETETGIKAKANVPSGASTGEHEALELRDDDKARYNGKGVLKAIQNVKEIVAPALAGMEVNQQKEIDQKMIELDGTANKSKLGANAILGVSLAVCRAAALSQKKPLYKYISELSGFNEKKILPTPCCNVINGGAHADSGLDFQEYMLVPSGIESVAEKIRALAEIYQKLKENLKKEGHTTAVGDEGGFAPGLKSNSEPLEYLVKAIQEAGYKVREQIELAMDVAASEFYNKEAKKYELKLENKSLSSDELNNYYKDMVEKYPVMLIEDGMAEDDLSGWQALNEKLADKISIMGDDFTVTNIDRLENAIKNKALNSILIKLNQIGTVTETIECIELARKNQIKYSVSHRSGETSDDFIADFAVGVGADWLKSGAVARSERVAKYNRLLEIEREL